MDLLTKYTAELRKRIIDLRDELKTAYDSISQLDGANSSLMAANEKLAADRKALINELCQYCGKYKQAHEGACDGCKWRGNVMDAVKFLNSRRRTCDSYPGCNGCEWKGKPCPGYVTYAPFSATQYERVKPNENAVKKESAE